MVDEHGAPVPGIDVELFSGNGTLFRQGKMRTNNDGRYSFEVDHAAAGDGVVAWMWLRIEHESLVSADGESMWPVDVPLVPGTVVEKDFVMIEGGAIEGFLFHATTDEPIQKDLRVYTGTSYAMRYLRGAATDERGHFVAQGLFPGVYWIDVNCADSGEASRYPILGTVKVEVGEMAIVELRWDQVSGRAR